MDVVLGGLIEMHFITLYMYLYVALDFLQVQVTEEPLLGNARKQCNFSIFKSNILKLEDSLQNAALEISDAALQNILTQALGSSGDSN